MPNLTEHFYLQAGEGLLLRGAPRSQFARCITAPGMFEQVALTWSAVAGYSVSEEETLAEMRRSFDWHDFLTRAATLLAATRASLVRGDGLAGAQATLDALSDEWPYRIAQPRTIQTWLRRVAPRTSTVTSVGVLALMGLALRDPWITPTAALRGSAASQRFARLAMIASDLPPRREYAGPFATAQILLDVQRTEVFDHAIPRLARSYQMYAELLPELMPDVATAFRSASGVDLEVWVGGLCAINNQLETHGYETGQPMLTINLAGVDPAELSPPVRALRAIAAPREWYRAAFVAHGPYAVSPFRERPVVAFGDGQYLVLHDDYLLTAADEGVVARIKEGLSEDGQKALGTPLGAVFQAYVGTVLRRCFGSESVVDVPTATGQQRCDFAVRCGDDLLLIDAKRMHLGTRLVDGIDDIDCLVRPLRKGLRQLLATVDAIDATSVAAVAPALDPSGTWKPRRRFAWLAVQYDLPIWFSAQRALVNEVPELRDRWTTSFRGRPLVVSITDLERLEAAGARFVGELLSQVADDDPRAYGGVPRFLDAMNYRGPIVSEAVSEKRKQILARNPWSSR